MEKLKNDNVRQSAVEFIEWLVELLPSEYDTDTRHRFTPQVKSPKDSDLMWIETHKYSIINPKFYTTDEVYELWLTK